MVEFWSSSFALYSANYINKSSEGFSDASQDIMNIKLSTGHLVVLVWKWTEIVVRDPKSVGSHILIRGLILSDVIYEVHKLLFDEINLN